MKKKIKTVWYYNGIEERQFVEGQQPAGFTRGRKPNLLSETSIQKMIENQKKHFRQKYGVDWALQLKEVQDKRVNTTLERYGVPYIINLPEVQQKAILAMHSDEADAKRANTNLERYGAENVFAAEPIKNKIKQTCLARYDVYNIYLLPKYQKLAVKRSRTKEAKEKRARTLLAKYNVDNYVKSLQYHKTARKRYIYDNISFDSSWELAVYIYAKDHNITIERCPISFNYVYNGRIYTYFPDFMYDGFLLEIKSDHFFDNGHLINPYLRTEDEDNRCKVKQQCMLDNNVVIWRYKEIQPILKYMINTYSKNWINYFTTLKGN